MRRVSVLLATLTLASLQACGKVGIMEPDVTIQVQGTVTVADDGSPIAGVPVLVFSGVWGPTHARVTTDASGFYSLSFATEGGCHEDEFDITVGGLFFRSFRGLLLWSGNSGIRCTDELQILDFQLERIPPPEPAGD